MLQRLMASWRATLLICGLVGFCASIALAQNTKPISKDALMQALKIGGLSAQELVGIVHRRGVDFAVDPPVEAELRKAGAANEVIEAVKSSCRTCGSQHPPAAAAPVTPPPAQAPHPPVSSTLAPAPTPLPNNHPAKTGAATLSEVRRLFITEMPPEFQQYIRIEISKQMNGRILVTLDRNEADAIMTGAVNEKSGTTTAVTGTVLGIHDTASGTVNITDLTGKRILWTGEAGDRRSPIVGSFSKGGQAKVAERLVKSLKKSLGI